MNQRLIDATGISEEKWLENFIRPKCLHEYIGQSMARQQMEIFIQAATARREALDYVLIFGSPGLGKNHFSPYHRE